MPKRLTVLLEFLFLLIITIPAFISLMNNQYFSMHDDQHIVRLYLLDQGIRQGYLFPRWVDGLGFGYGYPLFNFYPPLIYYISELFHLIGFSLIWSIKLVFILGFYIGVVGMYQFMKKLTDKYSAFLAAALYTFFFYHAVLIYVRGALAEFIGLSILPFLFLTLFNLSHKANGVNTILFGITWALLILTHPLVAFPSIIFIFLISLFLFLISSEKWKFTIRIVFGFVFGLALSSFFWLPSLYEKKFTLVDSILTRELANYKLHFIEPFQFLFSLWGYGGSAPGISDGMTFQLGKVHIGLAIGAVIMSTIYLVSMSLRVPTKSGRGNLFLRLFHFVHKDRSIQNFIFFLFLLLLSLFMSTPLSIFVWDRIGFLSYLQFPWRFLTFTTIFISIVAAYAVFFMGKFIPKRVVFAFSLFLIILTVVVYSKYFKPQNLYETSDRRKTSDEEVRWVISRSSYEFVPKGVETKKTEIGTTVLDIEKKDIPKETVEIVAGKANVEAAEQKFLSKKFDITAFEDSVIRINTFYFPGWRAYLDGKEVSISDKNRIKLIEVIVPQGDHKLELLFTNTPIRVFAHAISILAIVIVFFLLLIDNKRIRFILKK